MEQYQSCAEIIEKKEKTILQLAEDKARLTQSYLQSKLEKRELESRTGLWRDIKVAALGAGIGTVLTILTILISK